MPKTGISQIIEETLEGGSVLLDPPSYFLSLNPCNPFGPAFFLIEIPKTSIHDLLSLYPQEYRAMCYPGILCPLSGDFPDFRMR